MAGPTDGTGLALAGGAFEQACAFFPLCAHPPIELNSLFVKSATLPTPGRTPTLRTPSTRRQHRPTRTTPDRLRHTCRWGGRSFKTHIERGWGSTGMPRQPGGGGYLCAYVCVLQEQPQQQQHQPSHCNVGGRRGHCQVLGEAMTWFGIAYMKGVKYSYGRMHNPYSR